MAKKEKKEKSGKGAGIGAAIAALILLLGGGAWGTGLLPGGGSGNGPISDILKPNTTNEPTNNDTDKDSDDKKEQTIVIKIEQSEISVGGEVCENAYDMIAKVKKIMADNAKTTFELQTITPVNSTYEQVTDALKNIEGIKVTGLE